MVWINNNAKEEECRTVGVEPVSWEEAVKGSGTEKWDWFRSRKERK